MNHFLFTLQAKDPGGARAGVLRTPHGLIETPIFMPVGTQATVKNMSPEELEGLGAEIILSNTYHLFLRPGAEVVAELGGLHKLMQWNRPILTDSGGFQVFSLSSLRTITDEGVTFRSHLDGSKRFLGPEESIAVQEALGSDIAMAFDECPPGDAAPALIDQATRRSTAWLRRAIQSKTRDDQALFGIIQGGVDVERRKRHLDEVCSFDLPGYALGGLSVGESTEDMRRIVREITPLMPSDRPRYLMGVGTPEDLVESIAAGIDMFDCVMPTRNARHGTLFTEKGRIHITNASFARDPGPIEPGCDCYACTKYSRAYLRHLFMAQEGFGLRLATIHNLRHYLRLVQGARAAIVRGEYDVFRAKFWEGRTERVKVSPAVRRVGGPPKPAGKAGAALGVARGELQKAGRGPGASSGAAEKAGRGPGEARGAGERAQGSGRAAGGALQPSGTSAGKTLGSPERAEGAVLVAAHSLDTLPGAEGAPVQALVGALGGVVVAAQELGASLLGEKDDPNAAGALPDEEESRG
jgi:queuine tRNA-ribosyltransferase